MGKNFPVVFFILTITKRNKEERSLLYVEDNIIVCNCTVIEVFVIVDEAEDGYYDPESNMIALNSGNETNSISSVAIAIHEVGYILLRICNS